MRQFTLSPALLLGVALCVSAGYLYEEGGENSINSIEGIHHEEYSYPQYTFKYSVHDPHTGDHKNQWESREGDVVKGSYSLMEPDGTIRQVDYIADKIHGFRAFVKRKGKPIEAIETPKYAFHAPETYLHG